MFHKYPYTDFHELNLDYIMKLARESLGIHLEVVGDKLQLKNAAGDVISNVTISYATKAGKDEDGKDIEAYIYDAGLDGRAIVFTRGNNDTEVIPFPEDAVTDVNGKNITSYVANVSFSGENLVVTYGDNTSYSFKCPYALKAQTDANGKDIETYMATVTVVGNALVFKDGAGVTLAEITVPYATTAGEAEVAEKARKDINGNPFVSDYGRNLIVDGNKIGIEAHDGTDLNKITVPFASLSTNATNAIQTVTISGNNIIFTTYGGAQTSIQAPYAVKAQKDDLGNNIKSTYVANVINNSQTGEISFMDAQGQEIVSIIPTVDSAVHDSLGNDITDYIKSILTSPNSNFVTVTHGDNTVDTLTINYSTIAWKDTYGNAIGNTYCSLLTMGVDPQDGEPIVIGWNGETPKAEIFRLKVQAVSAQKDGLGNVIHEYYAHSMSYNNNVLQLINAEGTVLSSVTIEPDEEENYYFIFAESTAGRVENINAFNTTVTEIRSSWNVQVSKTLDEITNEVAHNGARVALVVSYSDGTYGGGFIINCDINDAGQLGFSEVFAIVDPDEPTRWITKYAQGFFTYNNDTWECQILGENLPNFSGNYNDLTNTPTIPTIDNILVDSNTDLVTDMDIDGTSYEFFSGNYIDLEGAPDEVQYLDISGGIGPTAQTMSWPQETVDLDKTLVLRANFNGKTVYIPESERSGGYVNFYYADNMLYYYNSNSIYSMIIDKVISYNMAGGSHAWSISSNGTENWDILVKANDTSGTSGGDLTSINLFGTSYTIPSGGGGGGGSSLVVTLTGAYAGVTIDLASMTQNSSISVSADSAYAAIKAADDIIFKIVDTTQAGSKYTLKPTGMYTLNVAADQSLYYTFSVVTPSNSTPKVFTLEVGPWSNMYTFRCVA